MVEDGLCPGGARALGAAGNYAGYEGGGICFATPAPVRNCIVVNNVAGYGAANLTDPTLVTYSCSPGLTTGTGNTTADPLFRNAGSGTPGLTFVPGDYHLQGASPCVDRGTALGWHTGEEDFDGASRKIGRAVDMGVCEAPAGGTQLILR